jgi:hypothetical protein
MFNVKFGPTVVLLNKTHMKVAVLAILSSFAFNAATAQNINV